jgi:Ca-activated chloride channel family protein
LSEARKVLVEEASSTLFPIAKDVKIQLELNPALVSEYRLIGYETRALRREDFNNDKVDAGDVGSGHAVTAIYEITPADAKSRAVDDLRYGTRRADEDRARPAGEAKAEEIGFLKLRYKLPAEETSRLMTTTIRLADEKQSLETAPAEVRFAVAVAGFGQIVKGGEWTGSFGYDDAARLAMGAKGDDPFGLRAEFVNLVRLAKSAQP